MPTIHTQMVNKDTLYLDKTYTTLNQGYNIQQTFNKRRANQELDTNKVIFRERQSHNFNNNNNNNRIHMEASQI